MRSAIRQKLHIRTTPVLLAAPYCFTGITYDYYYNGLGESPETLIAPCTTYYENTLPVSFGLQTSKSVFNYDGTQAASDTTTYKWQDGSLSSNPYYTKNLLTLPCLQSVYSPSQPAGVPVQCAISAQTNLLAETSYGYDEPNGSPSGIRGNQTSVSRWLNTGGGPVKTTVVYNSQGMPTDAYDGNLNAGLPGNHVHTSYDTTGLFPWSIQQSNTGSTAHIDYYSYDLNTGNVLWHTDENGAAPTGNTPGPAHTTFYSYDFFGQADPDARPADSSRAGRDGHRIRRYCAYGDDDGTRRSEPPTDVSETI